MLSPGDQKSDDEEVGQNEKEGVISPFSFSVDTLVKYHEAISLYNKHQKGVNNKYKEEIETEELSIEEYVARDILNNVLQELTLNSLSEVFEGVGKRERKTDQNDNNKDRNLVIEDRKEEDKNMQWNNNDDKINESDEPSKELSKINT